MTDPSRPADPTPRPWQVFEFGAYVSVGTEAVEDAIIVGYPGPETRADAALIVEAVNNYDRLRAIEAAARAATERWLAEDAKGLDGAMADLTAELR